MTLTDNGPAVVTDRGGRRHRAAFGEPLTLREWMVLNLISQGFTNVQIGYACGIAEQTVKNHLSEILAKTGAPNRVRAAVLFDRWQRGTS